MGKENHRKKSHFTSSRDSRKHGWGRAPTHQGRKLGSKGVRHFPSNKQMRLELGGPPKLCHEPFVGFAIQERANVKGRRIALTCMHSRCGIIRLASPGQAFHLELSEYTSQIAIHSLLPADRENLLLESTLIIFIPPSRIHVRLPPLLRPDLIPRNILRVLVDDCPAKAPLQYQHRSQNKPRPDLDQRNLRLLLLALLLLLVRLPDLVDANPDLAVQPIHCNSAVDERLHSPHAPRRHAEQSSQHLSDQ